MLSELAEDAILIANKAYSINLLTRSSLYAIRELPSRDKIPKVLSSIEESIKYDQKFESFVGIIKTITSHADLADSMNRSYQFQLVHHMMQRVSKSDVDLTLLCNKLNDRNLISDDVKRQALNSPSHEVLCRVVWKDLESCGLGEQFLNFIQCFGNTRSLDVRRNSSSEEGRMDVQHYVDRQTGQAPQRSSGEQLQYREDTHRSSTCGEEHSDTFMSAKEYSTAGLDEFADVSDRDVVPLPVNVMVTSRPYSYDSAVGVGRATTSVDDVKVRNKEPGEERK